MKKAAKYEINGFAAEDYEIWVQDDEQPEFHFEKARLTGLVMSCKSNGMTRIILESMPDFFEAGLMLVCTKGIKPSRKIFMSFEPGPEVAEYHVARPSDAEPVGSAWMDAQGYFHLHVKSVSALQGGLIAFALDKSPTLCGAPGQQGGFDLILPFLSTEAEA